jgi:hypothetical protein
MSQLSNFLHRVPNEDHGTDRITKRRTASWHGKNWLVERQEPRNGYLIADYADVALASLDQVDVELWLPPFSTRIKLASEEPHEWLLLSKLFLNVAL